VCRGIAKVRPGCLKIESAPSMSSSPAKARALQK
jgi:hypothetical protein